MQVVIHHTPLRLGPSEDDHLQILYRSRAVSRTGRWDVFFGFGKDFGPFEGLGVEGKDVVGYLVVGIGHGAAEKDGAEGGDEG